MGLPTTFRLNLAVWPSEHLQEEGFRTNTGLYSLSSWASSVSSSRRAGEWLGERLSDRGEVDLQRKAVELSRTGPSKRLGRGPQTDACPHLILCMAGCGVDLCGVPAADGST